MRNAAQRILPIAGTEFERIYEGKVIKMKVVALDGHIRYEVAGKLFSSPSGAASSITNSSVNGWTFWGIDKRALLAPRKKNINV